MCVVHVQQDVVQLQSVAEKQLEPPIINLLKVLIIRHSAGSSTATLCKCADKAPSACTLQQVPYQGEAHLHIAIGDAASVAELQRHQQLLQQASCLDLRQAAALQQN